jgi:hypothetical protein
LRDERPDGRGTDRGCPRGGALITSDSDTLNWSPLSNQVALGSVRRWGADPRSGRAAIAVVAAEECVQQHYRGFPAVLVRLAAIDASELEELVRNAWLCQAPRDLADALSREC